MVLKIIIEASPWLYCFEERPDADQTANIPYISSILPLRTKRLF
jgi:hypothetical protein